MKKGLFVLAIIAVVIMPVCFVGCADSTILYGVWKNSSGDEVTLVSDGTFTAYVPSSGDTSEYAGNYSVLQNVIQFTATDGNIFLSTYSIDGGILYLTWTPDDSTNDTAIAFYRTKVPEPSTSE